MKLETKDDVSITLYCKAENCHGWIIIDNKNDAKFFACPLCGIMNCRTCNDIHTGLTCKEYERNQIADTNENDPNIWVCAFCTVINKHDGLLCDVCDNKRDDEECVQSLDSETLDNKQYDTLLELDDLDLIPNNEEFECSLCMDIQEPGDGVRLHECVHQFCKLCLEQWISMCTKAEIPCPYVDDDYTCDGSLQEREVRALVSEEIFIIFLNRSLNEAVGRMKNCFQCRTADCENIWIYNDEDDSGVCQICQKINCYRCKVR